MLILRQSGRRSPAQWRKIIEVRLARPFGLLRVVTTIDELRLRGAEIDGSYLVTDGFKVYGGYGRTDGKIQENRHRLATEGNEAPLAPKYTLNLGGQWQQNLGDALDLVVRLDYSRIGATWFHTVQDNQQLAIWTPLLGFPVQSDMSLTNRDGFDTLDPARQELDRYRVGPQHHRRGLSRGGHCRTRVRRVVHARGARVSYGPTSHIASERAGHLAANQKSAHRLCCGETRCG